MARYASTGRLDSTEFASLVGNMKRKNQQKYELFITGKSGDSDVILEVEDKVEDRTVQFHALRALLKIHSEFFQALWESDAAADDKVIKLQDSSIVGIRAIIDVSLGMVENVVLEASTVADLFYAGHKYGCQILIDTCKTWMAKKFPKDMANYWKVIQGLNKRKLFNVIDEELVKHGFYSNQAALRYVFGLCSIDSANSVSRSIFEQMIKSDYLREKEETIYSTVIKMCTYWTKPVVSETRYPQSMYYRNDSVMSINTEEARSMFLEFRSDIRFTNMSLEFLVNEVKQSGLLTDEEIYDILCWKGGNRTKQVFCTTKSRR